jgi:hypothetical protein
VNCTRTKESGRRYAGAAHNTYHDDGAVELLGQLELWDAQEDVDGGADRQPLQKSILRRHCYSWMEDGRRAGTERKQGMVERQPLFLQVVEAAVDAVKCTSTSLTQ